MLEIGRVIRPHGLAGEVVVELVSNRPERLAPGSVLQGEQPGHPAQSGRTGGALLRVARSRRAPGRDRWVVRFEGVNGRDAAEGIRGTVLMAPPLDDPDAFWVHELVGCSVQSSDGTRLGEVVALEANPASDLLVLDSGALIPLRFVTERGEGWLRVDAPPGLVEQ